MKKNIIYSAATLLATLIIAVFPTEAEGKIYEDTLRLHILANSDSDEDQSLKLEIRDRILQKYGEELSKSDGTEEAVSAAQEALPEIVNDAKRWIRELGYDYEVRATISVEWYDTREYEDFSLPCGYYNSLRVIIGEGNGKNWWCVMYPPLCMDIASEKAPSDDGIIDYTKEELMLVRGGRYNIKFKSLEILSSLFSKND